MASIEQLIALEKAVDDMGDKLTELVEALKQVERLVPNTMMVYGIPDVLGRVSKSYENLVTVSINLGTKEGGNEHAE